MMRATIIAIAFLGAWLSGVNAPVEARPSRTGQVGWASWYGSFHHGKPTANGERFSMYSLTAAHRTLPLGTTVAVTHLGTGRQVVARINDRGPYVNPRRRIIDLSRAAARRLGIEHPGLAPVRVEVQRAPARSARVAAAPQRVSQAPLPRRGHRS
jgi:rare lipoprotein A